MATPGTANTHAPSTICRRNLKRVLITLKPHQMFFAYTSLEKSENATITGHFGFVFEEIVTSSFWKSSILKMFSVHIKTQSRRFQIPRVWTVFSFEERPFSGRIIVDGRPNRRNKASFSNFSGVMWMRPQYNRLSSITNQTWRSNC